MNAEVFKRLSATLAPIATNGGAVYYPPDAQFNFAAHLTTGKPWIKAYSPIEESGQQVMEDYLVIIDVGATNLEAARHVSNLVRTALRSTHRQPSGYRLMRIAPLEEEGYRRFQHTYRRTLRP